MSVLSSSTPMSSCLHDCIEPTSLFRSSCGGGACYHNLHAPLLVLLELLSLVQPAWGDGGPNPGLGPTCSLGPCLEHDAMAIGNAASHNRVFTQCRRHRRLTRE